MPRKHDAHKDELEGVAQRLRDERPEANPLDLDRIKTSAMARAKAGSNRGRAGTRRLAVLGLTAGLLVATTGGVFAWSGGGKDSKGSAANAQYGGECNIFNGNGNQGNENGSNAENYACNENSFNKTTITETNSTTITNNITNSYNGSTVTVTAPAPTAGVLGSSTTKAKTSSKRVNFHINVSKKTKLRKVTLKVNGKVVSVLKGKAAKANVSIANLPCSATVTVTAVTASGKTVTATHVYKLC